MHLGDRTTRRWRGSGMLVGLAIVASTVALTAACQGQRATPTPEGNDNNATPTPAAAASGTPALNGDVLPTPEPNALSIIVPADGASTEVRWVAVVGTARLDAVVSVDGETVDVDENGVFATFAPVDTDAALIETVASEPLGGETTDSRAVFYAAPTGGSLPFSLFYPTEGLETTHPAVRVMGGTSPDAVVTVNGETVEVDERGTFSATVRLEEGPNLIEVNASAQLGSGGRTAQVMVFFIPETETTG